MVSETEGDPHYHAVNERQGGVKTFAGMKAAGCATILDQFLRGGIIGRSRFVILASQRDF